MGNILVSASHFDELCKEAWALLEQNGHKVIYNPNKAFPAYTFDELKDIIGDIDGAIIGLDEYTKEVFEIAPRLKVVAKFGVGVDNIDLEAATRHRVKVLNAPGQNSNAVAELTVGFMIDLLRKIIPLHKSMEQNQWPRLMGWEIKGKTVGLIGFGAIAQLVAEKLSGFGVRILATDPLANEERAKALGVTLTSLDQILAESDIVSLHIPATPETYHMFDKKRFSQMKKGAYLINTARGALVDLEALYDALQSGELAGAALDAFEVEPLPEDSPLLKCENVVLTPHTGAETYEAYRNVSLCTAQGVMDVLDGKEPQFWVNRW